MELERCWYLMPPTKSGQEMEEAAALLDFAKVERKEELYGPLSDEDMSNLGIECRRRGKELLVRYGFECEVQCLMEIDKSEMAKYRACAALEPGSSRGVEIWAEEKSEVLKVGKFKGMEGCVVKFISNKEVYELVVKSKQPPCCLIYAGTGKKQLGVRLLKMVSFRWRSLLEISFRLLKMVSFSKMKNK